MYEDTRPHAPNSSQLAGASVTVVIAALTGYVLTTGIAMPVITAFQPPMVVVALPDKPPEPVEDLKPFDDIDLQARLPMPLPPQQPDTGFYSDDSPIKVVTTATIPDPRPPTLRTVEKLAPPVAPKIRPAEPPPYPAACIRGNCQGTTGLSVCIDARGRVTQASVTETSGHAVLDTAALKWVRDARFTPGSVGGAAQAVCDHPVFYEWKLENKRR